MCKRKAEIGIGQRMYEEILRLFPSDTEAAVAIGCNRSSLKFWRNGSTPSAMFISRLYFAGGDVLYVLTGRRVENVK